MLHLQTLPPSTLDLLRQLSAAPEWDDFSLAGGTSLALRFGHRLSVDLDFFTRNDFNKDSAEHVLSAGRTCKIEQRNTAGLSATVNGVKVDVVTYRYPFIQEPEVVSGIRLMSLPDVAAMKLSAVTNRGAKKDFYDLAILIDSLGLAQLIEFYGRKFPSHAPLMMIRSLSYFDDAESDDDPVSLVGMEWRDVKKRISTALQTFL